MERYKDEDLYEKLIENIKADLLRSNEDFIKHYKEKYDSPEIPPSWMTLEAVSFGALSRMYGLLRDSREKQQVAEELGIRKSDVLSNWLHAFFR